MMGQRYPSGQYDSNGVYQASLCDSMVKQLWVFLDQSGTDLKYEQYCDKVERWMN